MVKKSKFSMICQYENALIMINDGIVKNLISILDLIRTDADRRGSHLLFYISEPATIKMI